MHRFHEQFVIDIVKGSFDIELDYPVKFPTPLQSLNAGTFRLPAAPVGLMPALVGRHREVGFPSLTQFHSLPFMFVAHQNKAI